MGTVPVPHTWVAGDDATSTVMQTLTDAILYLLGSATSGGSKKPLCHLRQTVSQTPATGVWTAVTFDTEDVDYDSSHSTVTNTDRFTAATTGWHHVEGGAEWPANATGRRGVRFTVAAAAINGSGSVLPAGVAAQVTTPSRGLLIFLNAGDILRMEIFQDSTVGLATVVVAPNQSTMSVYLVSN